MHKNPHQRKKNQTPQNEFQPPKTLTHAPNAPTLKFPTTQK